VGVEFFRGIRKIFLLGDLIFEVSGSILRQFFSGKTGPFVHAVFAHFDVPC